MYPGQKKLIITEMHFADDFNNCKTEELNQRDLNDISIRKGEFMKLSYFFKLVLLME